MMKIIEISLVDQSGKVLLNELIRPVGDVSDEAYQVHGISTEKAKSEGKCWSDVFESVCDIVRGENLVIYNSDFDTRLIFQTMDKHLVNNNIPDTVLKFEPLSVHCAMKEYADYWGAKDENHHSKCQSLVNACKQQQVPLRNAHRASEDCLMTLDLIQAIWRKEG